MGLAITLKEFELLQIGESVVFLEQLTSKQWRLVVHNIGTEKVPVNREAYMSPEVVKQIETHFNCEKSMWARKSIKDKIQKHNDFKKESNLHGNRTNKPT